MNKQNLKNKNLLIGLIFITIAINFIFIFTPLIREDDPTLYASIAKNMLLNQHWAYLYKDHAAWLDKPHFLFWVSALSFKIFGFKSFAYILPGFIFYVMGGIYTYRLTKLLYKETEAGLFAALCYFTACHLLISSIDLRAEAYLLGMVIPAYYYWYLYDISNRLNYKALFIAAIFTACAIMTKGIFLLITIISGLCILWIYQKRWRNFVSIKWLLALGLSLIFTAPELIASYIQFGTKSIYWFFWGSQFGRFFNIGAITQSNINAFHDIFFIHTFLWSFLPWTIIFFVAAWYMIKQLCENNPDNQHSCNFEKLNKVQEKSNSVFLFASFGVTFILFSLSKFQLDYYINIILPFAAIICGQWLYQMRIHHTPDLHKVLKIQIYIAGIILLIGIVAGSIAFSHTHLPQVISFDALIIILSLIILLKRHSINKALTASTLAINVVFVSYMSLYCIVLPKYDAGYQVAKFLNNQPVYAVIGYEFPSSAFSFNYKYNNMLLFYPTINTAELNKMMQIPSNSQLKPKPNYSPFSSGTLKYATDICLIANKLHSTNSTYFNFYFVTQTKYNEKFLQAKYKPYFSLIPIKTIYSMTSDQAIKSIFAPYQQNLNAGTQYTIFKAQYNYKRYCTSR